MKRIFAVLLLLCTIVFCACSTNNSGVENINSPKESAYKSKLIEVGTIASQEELLNKVTPAVVGILAVVGRTQSIGTGVCIDEKNYIITNNHVIEGATIVKIYLSNGETANANVIWTDTSADLAIIQSEVTIPFLPLAQNGYSVGEDVVAIGTPIALAFKHSATKGIISATNRTLQVDNAYGESTLNNLIQHDASINPGNSGGPLINMKGEVLGINTVKVADAEGMGFAIPVEITTPILTKLKANGHYKTSYMGVFGFDANLKQIGVKKDGFFVQSVAEKSPAFEMGLQKNDVILEVDNQQINCALELKKILYSHDSGDTINVKFERDGEIYILDIKLIQHPYCYNSEKLKMA